jgi:hypothetical protein
MSATNSEIPALLRKVVDEGLDAPEGIDLLRDNMEAALVYTQSGAGYLIEPVTTEDDGIASVLLTRFSEEEIIHGADSPPDHAKPLKRRPFLAWQTQILPGSLPHFIYDDAPKEFVPEQRVTPRSLKTTPVDRIRYLPIE